MFGSPNPKLFLRGAETRTGNFLVLLYTAHYNDLNYRFHIHVHHDHCQISKRIRAGVFFFFLNKVYQNE